MDKTKINKSQIIEMKQKGMSDAEVAKALNMTGAQYKQARNILGLKGKIAVPVTAKFELIDDTKTQ